RVVGRAGGHAGRRVGAGARPVGPDHEDELMQTAAVTTTTAWRWQATGTTWQIHHTGGVDEALAGWAAEAVARDEARWSRFIPTSEVSRVTASAGSPVPVDAD